MSRVKVWALVDGLRGYDALGRRITLQCQTVRWMDEDEARAAAAEDKVQLVAGLDTRSLRAGAAGTDPMAFQLLDDTTPPAPRRKKRTYRRRDVVAENPQD